MFNYKQEINNNIRIIKKHDQFHINNSSIYTNPLAYEKLSTYLTQKQKEHKSKYQRKSYRCFAGRISRLSKYKRRHIKKQLENNIQYI
jgi:hypothetical protein